MATRTEKPKENRFVVDLRGLPLTAEDHRSVAAAIQGAVLSFLATRYKLPNTPIRLTADDKDGGPGIEGMIVDLDDRPKGGARAGRSK